MSVWWLMKVFMLLFGWIGPSGWNLLLFCLFHDKFSTPRKKYFHDGIAFGSFKLLSFHPRKVYSVAYCSQASSTWFTREREGMVFVTNFRPDFIIDANTFCVEAVGES